MYFTRAVIDKNAGVAAIVPLLDPADPNQALDAHHRLIWTLFPDKHATRDFLWRSDGKGCFYILSRRKPVQSEIFLPLSHKEFAPALTSGDKLTFALRANATKTRRHTQGERDKQNKSIRVDIVMDSLYSIPGRPTLAPDKQSERSSKRMRIADQVAKAWLKSIGERVGFSIDKFQVDDYSVRELSRSNGTKVTLGILDMHGVILVDRPDPFISALIKGFGRAKAFGCGLMLIRRA